MTMPLSSTAFGTGTHHPMPRPAARKKQSRVFSVVVTVLIHAAAGIGLVTAVHVAPLKIPPALMAHISLTKPKPAEDAVPPPVLQNPAVITAPPPEVVIQTIPSPITVQPPAATPAPLPQVAAPAPQTRAGEGRETFLARLLSHLNRFKQYPRAARAGHIEGVVTLHFVMDAHGRILSAEIAKSSGRPVLDGEALALIRRAQPLPALPGDFPSVTLDAVVPVEFSLDG